MDVKLMMMMNAMQYYNMVLKLNDYNCHSIRHHVINCKIEIVIVTTFYSQNSLWKIFL